MNEKFILRRFALSFSVVFLFWAIFFYLKRDADYFLFLILSGLFLLCAVFRPSFLGLTYKLWLNFSQFIFGLITSLTLTLVYFLVITPYGLVIRIFNHQLLDTKIAKETTSYWRKKETTCLGKSKYEHQF